MQNTSHAVMAQRVEPKDSRDDFPTPPWATRGLIEHVIGPKMLFERQTCLEPACGAGHMSKVLEEYFGRVDSSDKFDYAYGSLYDYLDDDWPPQSVDWVITNPPFRLAEEFVLEAILPFEIVRCAEALRKQLAADPLRLADCRLR